MWAIFPVIKTGGSADERPPQDPGAKLSSISAAHKFFSEDKETVFEARVCNHFESCTRISYLMACQMTDEETKLLSFQQQLEKESNGQIKFFGLSVNDTITTCLLNGMAKRAEKVRSDFKVPDKRYALITRFAHSYLYCGPGHVDTGTLNSTLILKHETGKASSPLLDQSVVLSAMNPLYVI